MVEALYYDFNGSRQHNSVVQSPVKWHITISRETIVLRVSPYPIPGTSEIIRRTKTAHSCELADFTLLYFTGFKCDDAFVKRANSTVSCKRVPIASGAAGSVGYILCEDA